MRDMVMRRCQASLCTLPVLHYNENLSFKQTYQILAHIDRALNDDI